MFRTKIQYIDIDNTYNTDNTFALFSVPRVRWLVYQGNGRKDISDLLGIHQSNVICPDVMCYVIYPDVMCYVLCVEN